MQTVKTLIVNKSKNSLPKYGSLNASGFDLQANIEEPIKMKALERVLIPTGLHIQVPAGFETQIRPRSGNAIKKGITVLNSPGTIDSDFSGQIQVILINLSREEITISPGDKIAQGVIVPVVQAAWFNVDSIEEFAQTSRGTKGFGSTDKNQ